jgi:hypothetical protein
MAQISVLIVADKDTDLDGIKMASESHGLKNISTLPRLGILRGFIDAGLIAALEKIPGVRSVEKEGEINLPPRDSPVQ